ncbi:MAG: PAS domain S-box protein, partial [Thermoleophilaceae bacterium]|nr:PAS domain S-box protein [Thermoleophilaceae bacterium]
MRRTRMSDLSNDLFAQAFASAPIGMVLVSIDSSSAGRFVEVNRAFCRMVGRSEEELLGMG